MENVKELNKDYMDLYGNCLDNYVELPLTSTFDDIIRVAKSNSIIGYRHEIKVGSKYIIAERKYTWHGKVAKTAYLHIWQVSSFEEPYRVLKYWREQKNGNFKVQ